MPRFLPNTCFSDCWSSVGNVTFYHIDGKCYWKSRPKPEFPATESQLVQQDIHRRAIEAWRSIPESDKEKWYYYAKDVISHKPPFDNQSRITGYNLFVSAYHGFATLGNEHTPKPQPFKEFPSFTANYSHSIKIGDTIRIYFHIPEVSNDYQILIKAHLSTRPNNNPGLLRNYLASEITDGKCFIELSSIEAAELYLNTRIILIDKERGYRSQYLNFFYEL